MDIARLVRRCKMYDKAEELILEVVEQNKKAETMNHFDLYCECIKYIGDDNTTIREMQELVHKTSMTPAAVERARRHLVDKGVLEPLRGGKECEEVDRYINK